MTNIAVVEFRYSTRYLRDDSDKYAGTHTKTGLGLVYNGGKLDTISTNLIFTIFDSYELDTEEDDYYTKYIKLDVAYLHYRPDITKEVIQRMRFGEIQIDDNGPFNLLSKVSEKLDSLMLNIVKFPSIKIYIPEDKNRQMFYAASSSPCWGLFDINGKAITPEVYKGIELSKEVDYELSVRCKYFYREDSIISVTEEGLYISECFDYGRKGEVSINITIGHTIHEYKSQYNMRNTVAVFQRECALFGIVNKSGKIIVSASEGEIIEVYDNYYIRKTDKGLTLFELYNNSISYGPFDDIKSQSPKEDCFVFEKDGKKGLIVSGFYVPCKYEDLRPINKHFCQVTANGRKWLYNIESQEFSVETNNVDYDSTSNDNYILVWYNSLCGLFDTTIMKQIIPCSFSYIAIHENIAAIFNSIRHYSTYQYTCGYKYQNLDWTAYYGPHGTTVGLFDLSSSKIIVHPGIYGTVEQRGRIFRMWKKKKSENEIGCCGVNGSHGETILSCKYISINPVDIENQVFIVQDDNKYYLTTTGDKIISKKYDKIFSISTKPLTVWNGVLQPSRNFPRVKMPKIGDGLYGFINTIGEEIIPCIYHNTRHFRSGLAAVQNCETMKWGFISEIGDVVIPFEFDNAKSFSFSLAPVKRGDLWGYINVNNETMIPFCYSDAYGFEKDNKLFNIHTDTPQAVVYIKEQKYGINLQGDIVDKYEEPQEEPNYWEDTDYDELAKSGLRDAFGLSVDDPAPDDFTQWLG